MSATARRSACGWGLYKGNDIRDDVRKIYYAKFRQLLFGATQSQMLTSLQRTPAAPGQNDDYSPPYDTLKSYLLTTSEWKRTSDAGLQTFLSSRLDSRWVNQRDGEIGKDRLDLAKAQFDFYAGDLHNGNPYSPAADDGAVKKARIYLKRSFPGLQRVYQGLLGMADKQFPPVSFNQKFPGTGAGGHQHGAGARRVHQRGREGGAGGHQEAGFRRRGMGAGRLQGSDAGQGGDAARADGSVYEGLHRPVAQCSEEEQCEPVWQPEGCFRQIDHPFERQFALAESVLVDVAKYLRGRAGREGKIPGSAGGGSMRRHADLHRRCESSTTTAGLMSLQQAVDRAADTSANKEDAARGMRDSASQATIAATTLGSNFAPDQEAQIDKRSMELLLQPIKNLDGQVASDLKGSGQSFCETFNKATLRKFPFDPLAKDEAKLDELGALLQPKTGQLWMYYEKAA